MIFIRFPDEQAFLDAVAPYEDDIPNLDVIGIIYQGGEWDFDGNVIVEPVAIPGYHVNMIGPIPTEFEPFVIDRPGHPYRIFAGE